MPRKLRQLKADLRRAGFSERAGKGSHTRWSHPLVMQPVTLAGHDGDDAKPYQERDVREALEALQNAQGRQP
jgi:predicted RNA binding protein YcfA (HicA-like mRNA interferase family)